jgi:excisionase family DNA binding protein
VLPELLTVQDLAKILKVTPEYVTRRLVFERRIRFIKVGRRTLFNTADIQDFLDARTVTPAE